MKFRSLRLLILLAIGGVIGSSALAHKGATGVVKERMTMMKKMADAMKALAPMIKGEADWNSKQVQESAAAIAAHANKITQSFPKGSDGHPSEAKPTIWTQWDKFSAEAKTLQEQAAALEGAAGNGAETAKPLFAGVVESCKSCHQEFRAEKH